MICYLSRHSVVDKAWLTDSQTDDKSLHLNVWASSMCHLRGQYDASTGRLREAHVKSKPPAVDRNKLRKCKDLRLKLQGPSHLSEHRKVVNQHACKAMPLHLVILRTDAPLWVSSDKRNSRSESEWGQTNSIANCWVATWAIAIAGDLHSRHEPLSTDLLIKALQKDCTRKELVHSMSTSTLKVKPRDSHFWRNQLHGHHSGLWACRCRRQRSPA